MRERGRFRAIALGFAAAAALALVIPGRTSGLLALFVLSFAPGAALAVALFPRIGRVDATLCGLVFTPVMVAVIAALAMLAGADAPTSVRIILVACLAGAVAWWFRTAPDEDAVAKIPRRLLALLVLSLVVVTVALPLTSEYWRTRSDAWFHAAIVAEIADRGLPPNDPYFAGMKLQYMWLYHVLIHVLASASRLDPFRVMAIINGFALSGLVLGVFQLSRRLSARQDRAVAAAAMVPLGLNAFFWFLLPVRLGRALTGNVRGTDEVLRQLNLQPFDFETVVAFMRIWHNPEFFLDKYLVMTAFSLGLTAMAVTWYGATDFLLTRRRFALMVVFVGTLSMLAFHTLVAVVTIGAFGIAFLLSLVFQSTRWKEARAAWPILASAVAAFLVASPYLLQVMSGRDSGHALPFDAGFNRTAAMLLSSFSALALIPAQKRFFSRDDAAATFYMLATVGVMAISLVIRLPESNAFDKPGYFVWFPLAVIGGWTLADVWARRAESLRFRALALGLTAFVILPVNVLAFAACYTMPTTPPVSSAESEMAAWVRTHTPRDAVFVDRDAEVSLLVTGPRPYLFGWRSYAVHWGYDRENMARRWHTVRSVYTDAPMDRLALATLGAAGDDVYIVTRTGEPSAVSRYPQVFDPVWNNGSLALFRLNGVAARATALDASPAPDIDTLMRESGLQQ